MKTIDQTTSEYCKKCKKYVIINRNDIRVREQYGKAVDTFYCPVCKHRNFITSPNDFVRKRGRRN